MNRTNFFNGMEVSADDLQYSQAALIQQIKKSRTDFSGKGVLSPVADYVQLDGATLSDGTPTIRILPFSAYNDAGERIETTYVFGLALDLTDPTNRQLGEQGELDVADFGWEDGMTYQICVKYIERGARPLPQETTATSYASRVYSGFAFYALRKGVDSLIEKGVNPYVILAEATYNETDSGKILQITNAGITQYCVIPGSRVGTTPSNTRTQSYDPQNIDNVANPTAITLDAHIHAINDPTAVSATNPHGITAESLGVDTKSVPTHEKLFHSNGLLSGANGVATTTSGFYSTVVPRVSLVDYLKVYNLANDERLHYKGATLKYFFNSEVLSVYLSLEDSNGIWPSNKNYKLYVSTATGNLFVCVSDDSPAINRTYTVYDSNTNEVLLSASPITESNINTDIHYLLYTFSFADEKGVSTIYNPSNFLAITDHRTFGSISADNLQRTAKNIFNIPYPINVKEIQFPDNSTINSSNGILTNANISNCIVAAPEGTFNVGSGPDANKIIIHAGLSILCPNGLTSQGTCKSISATYKINKVSTVSAPATQGTYYVFIGEPTEDATQTVYFSDNYIVSDITPTNPAGNSPCWYNPDLNEIRFYSGTSWDDTVNLARIGYITVDSLGDVSSANPDTPIKLVTCSDIYTDSFRSAVLSWVAPNYANRQGRASGTLYTATGYGYIHINIEQRTTRTSELYINGVLTGRYRTWEDKYGVSSSNDSMYFVSPGDTYQFNIASGTWYSVYEFIPCKM